MKHLQHPVSHIHAQAPLYEIQLNCMFFREETLSFVCQLNAMAMYKQQLFPTLLNCKVLQTPEREANIHHPGKGRIDKMS